MTRKKTKGTELSVFKGREAKLNRVIFQVLCSNKPLASYDVYLQIRRIKGYRHTKYQTIDRRLKALRLQQWIQEKGTKRTKPGSYSPLYVIALKAQTAIQLGEVNMDDFLSNANDRLLLELMAILSSFRDS